MSKDSEQAVYWNEEGGRRWVENIEHLEGMLAGLSSRLLASAAAQSGDQVLDIGCGGGITSAAIAKTVGPTGDVLGVDISAVILELTRRRFAAVANLSFEAADAGTFGFTPATFDLITSRFGVMFFHDPDAAFTNIRKAAKTGARLVFICWRGIKENPWMGAPAAAAFTVLPPPDKPGPEEPGPFSFAKPERVHRILAAAGFGNVEMTPLDESLNLGSVDVAVHWLTRMGPAAAALQEAGEEERTAAIAAMRAVFVESDTADGIIMPGAAWIVTGDAV